MKLSELEKINEGKNKILPCIDIIKHFKTYPNQIAFFGVNDMKKVYVDGKLRYRILTLIKDEMLEIAKQYGIEVDDEIQ